MEVTQQKGKGKTFWGRDKVLPPMEVPLGSVSNRFPREARTVRTRVPYREKARTHHSSKCRFASYVQGDSFGHMSAEPWGNNVTALTDGTLWCLERNAFEQIFKL
jgi:CRP-like cAMP-binding protein